MLLYLQVVVRLERSTQGNVWDVGESNRTRGRYIYTSSACDWTLHSIYFIFSFEASLHAGIDLKECVKLPKDQDLMDWVAVHGMLLSKFRSNF